VLGENNKFICDTIIYDFDGTLYDSFLGINKAFEESSVLVHKKKHSLSKKDIGPQLLELYKDAFGIKKEEEFSSFQKYFRHYYDEVFYNHGELYANVEALLSTFFERNINQYVVSNKPQEVLQKIITENKIDKYFNGVSGHPHGGKTLSKKFERLKQIINQNSLDPSRILVLGDTSEDFQMAVETRSYFVHASYGYGVVNKECISINSPLEILNLIQHDSRS